MISVRRCRSTRRGRIALLGTAVAVAVVAVIVTAALRSTDGSAHGPLSMGDSMTGESSGLNQSMSVAIGHSALYGQNIITNTGNQTAELISADMVPHLSDAPVVDMRAVPITPRGGIGMSPWPLNTKTELPKWRGVTIPKLAGYKIPAHQQAWIWVIVTPHERGRFVWQHLTVKYRVAGKTYEASVANGFAVCAPKVGPGGCKLPGR